MHFSCKTCIGTEKDNTCRDPSKVTFGYTCGSHAQYKPGPGVSLDSNCQEQCTRLVHEYFLKELLASMPSCASPTKSIPSCPRVQRDKHQPSFNREQSRLVGCRRTPVELPGACPCPHCSFVGDEFVCSSPRRTRQACVAAPS